MPVRELTPELAEKAREELNEDPKRLEYGLNHLKEWLTKQPHLIARTDDQWLAGFLRGCKFSLERTKKKLDLFYTLRSTIPELFSVKYNAPVMEEILDSGYAMILPRTGPGEPRISFFRFCYDSNKFNATELMSVLTHLQMITMLEDDAMVVAGQYFVVDFEGFGVGHVLQMTPVQLKKMVLLYQNSSPIRSKGIHFLNVPHGIEAVVAGIKVLLREKVRNRMFVHNKDLESFYKHIPKKYLPAEYGGNAGTMKEITDNLKKKIQENSSFFEEDLKYGTDESLRIGKSSTGEGLNDVGGSFRQLEID